MVKIKPGKYRHYKGSFYRVVGVGKHSETLEDLVFYECLYENPKAKLWARPVKMFQEKVLVEGKMVSRFKYIGEK